MKLLLFRFSFLAVLVILPVALFAQSGKIENVAAQSALVTEFDVNGLKVILKRRASAPTFAAGLFVRGGARNITAANAGIENFALHAATEAGTKYSLQALRRELSRTGSSISASSNGDYSAIAMAATRENFDKTWDLFADVSMNPAFASDDVERVREQIFAGLRDAESVPDVALDRMEERVVYAGHPYANDVQGNQKTIAALTPTDLRAYHKGLMQTSRLLLVVVGDIDADELKAKVAATFGKLPRGDYKEQPLPPLNFSKGSLDVTPRTIQTNYIKGVFSAPSLSSPDYFPMRVAMTILQQLVYEEVREKRQLSYAPSADLDLSAANSANIYVTAVDANQAVKVMLDQIGFLKKNTVNEQAIAAMAGSFLTNYYVGQETNTAQVAELARYELIGGGWRNSFEFLNKIREVKPADIQTVANKYMKNLRFVVIGNPSAIDRSIFLPTE
jgi:predicted Zn-dependent peptidase